MILLVLALIGVGAWFFSDLLGELFAVALLVQAASLLF